MRSWENGICLDSENYFKSNSSRLFCITKSQYKSKMIICGESLGHLGKNEAKILVVSDSVLSVDQKWDFEIMRFA